VNRIHQTESDALVIVNSATVRLVPGVMVSFAELRAAAGPYVYDRAITNGAGDKKAKQHRAQAMTSLNRAALGLGPHAEAAPVRAPLERELLRATEEAKTGNRKPKSQVLLLLEVLERLEADLAVPGAPGTDDVIWPPQVSSPDFHAWYNKHFASWQERTLHSQLWLARKLGVHDSLLSRWKTRPRVPNDDEKTRAVVSALETIFGRPKNEGRSFLDGRAAETWPHEIPNDDWLRRRIAKGVGKLSGLSAAERRSRRLAEYQRIQQSDLTSEVVLPYALGREIDCLPKLFARDWVLYLQDHMRFEKLPEGDEPIIERRQGSASADPNTGLQILPSRIRIRDNTARQKTYELSQVLGSCLNGVLVVPTNKRRGYSSEDVSVRLDPLFDREVVERLGLSIAACPRLLERHFVAAGIRNRVRKGNPDMSEPVVKITGLMKYIVKWLRQQPRFGRRLFAVAGLLPKKDLVKAQTDWKAYCDDVIRRYDELYEGKIDGANSKIDHAEPIKQILETNASRRALIRIFRHHATLALSSCDERSFGRAVLFRNAMLTGVKAICTYRPETDRRLNYTTANTGHIRLEESGLWRVVVPPEDLKNERSEAAKAGDDRALINLSCQLHPCLTEYLGWAREYLLAGRSSSAFFVRDGDNPRFTADDIGELWTRLSEQAMKSGHPDFRGCTTMNSIGARKAAATDTFNATGSLKEAAKHLVNTLRSAQVYIKPVAAKQTEASTRRTEQVDDDMHQDEVITVRVK
jgi:hypothetical protein